MRLANDPSEDIHCGCSRSCNRTGRGGRVHRPVPCGRYPAIIAQVPTAAALAELTYGATLQRVVGAPANRWRNYAHALFLTHW
jgi:hypothetical protein